MNGFIERSEVVMTNNYNTLKDQCNYNTQNNVINICLLVVAW
jgi:hypothetical protein